ncbi:MAG: hypothetical protein IPI43_33480 [Sandaracinaceae bacterium]|nr:hypothetical protein [Sandaracinaceae bacterium]MBK8589580.1 hypothetical protein [Sandaracinaceae bacterium]
MDTSATSSPLMSATCSATLLTFIRRFCIMRTFPSFRVSRSRLATAVVGFGVAATIACGDASPQMEDAATMLDDAATILRDMQTDANAQPVPLEPMVLDCDLSYQLVQTTNPGEVNQFVSTRSGAYDQVVVEDPTRWVVEHCGRMQVTTGSTAARCGDANVTCTGSLAPTPDCELSLPSYTGTTIQVTCGTVSRGQIGDNDTTTTVTYQSVRLVPR